MNKPFQTQKFGAIALNRRSFLVGTGALSVGVAFGGLGRAAALAQDGVDPAGGPGFDPSIFVNIEFGGQVRILYHKAEMGQSILTGLPMIIAEEMDADWARVVIERAPGVGEYGNQSTVGSTSTSGSYTDLRLIGAQVRHILLINAARMLDVPVEELTTEPHVVVHEPSGQRLDYGEIAASATVPDPLPEVSEEDLKSPDRFRIIGSDITRFDIPSKVDGTAVFGIDVDLPDMLYAAVLRPPVAGETPVDIDDAAALDVEGVVAVVPMPNGVAAVAESIHAARKAIGALQVSWTETSPARNFNSDDALEDGLATIADDSVEWVAQGEPGDFDGAARIERLVFRNDLVAHACMEPMSAVVRANEDGSFEVWAGVQNPNQAVNAVRRATGRDDAEVSVNVTLLGGGFGRRIEADYVRDAALLASHVPGRPVKLVYSREEDLHLTPYRPLAVQQVEAALDADDTIIGWRHRVLAPAYGAGDATSMETALAFDGFDFIAAGGGGHPYTEFRQTEYAHMPTGMKVGAWRGISDGYMKHAVETMIDHIADIRGEDPVDYRLSLLGPDHPASAVIRTAADMAGWHDYAGEDGRALGFAYSNALRSHTACVAEVSVDGDSGRVTVHKIWSAIDCGTVVMPDQVEAQMIGSILMSLSTTLREHVRVVGGVPQVTNFFDYQVMRQNDIPEIEVEIVYSGTAPTGVGEAAVSPTVPAVTNAVRRALGGVHVDRIPLLPDRVLAAIQA